MAILKDVSIMRYNLTLSDIISWNYILLYHFATKNKRKLYFIKLEIYYHFTDMKSLLNNV